MAHLKVFSPLAAGYFTKVISLVAFPIPLSLFIVHEKSYKLVGKFSGEGLNSRD